MDSFCSASALKVNLYRDDCPEALKLMRPILESNLPWAERSDSSLRPPGKQKELPEELVAAVQDANIYLAKERQLSSQGMSVRALTICGRTFSIYRPSDRNSNGLIFFKPLKVSWSGKETSGGYLPAHIDRIVRCPDGRYWLALKRLLPPIDPPRDNPFIDYPDFGAEIWSNKFNNELEVVPADNNIYHAIHQPWDAGHWVIKKLDRVSTL